MNIESKYPSRLPNRNIIFNQQFIIILPTINNYIISNMQNNYQYIKK